MKTHLCAFSYKYKAIYNYNFPFLNYCIAFLLTGYGGSSFVVMLKYVGLWDQSKQIQTVDPLLCTLLY